MLKGFHHAAISTPDLERSVRFCRELSGCTVVREFGGPAGIPAADALTGWRHSAARAVMLRLGDSHAEYTRLRAAGQMGLFEVGEFSLGVTDADLVLTFRNLHNFTAPARAHLNRAVFNALKSGGLYGVVDHTRRHNEPDNSENWRRMDPVLAIKEIQAAGFALVDYSDVHYRPDDELRYEVGRKSVTGNTDRFTLLFRKP